MPNLGQAARRGACAPATDAPCAAGTDFKASHTLGWLPAHGERLCWCAFIAVRASSARSSSAIATKQAKRPVKPSPRHAAPGQGAHRRPRTSQRQEQAAHCKSEMCSSGRKNQGIGWLQKTRHTCLSPPRAMATVRAEAPLSQERATARGASSVIGGMAFATHGPPPLLRPGGRLTPLRPLRRRPQYGEESSKADAWVNKQMQKMCVMWTV